MSLNSERDEGRSRVDRYHKYRNKEHARQYREKMEEEDNTTKVKKDTMKKLTEIEGVLRQRLESTSQRVSQMDQIISGVAATSRARPNNGP